MPNIVLTRIDNRLVHGQVATQWCGAIGANLILVANDEVAGNSLRQGLMNMAAPSYASMRYWTIQKTIDTIHKASAKQLIFIVCENPQDVVKLVEGGVPIKKVNIGNMHMADGKRQVAGSGAVDDSDVGCFQAAAGTRCGTGDSSCSYRTCGKHRQAVQVNRRLLS